IAPLARLVTGSLARNQFQLLVATLRLNQLLRQIDQLRQAQLEPVDDLCPRPRSSDVAQVRVQPVAARRAVLAGDDFDLFTGLQAVVERYDTAVDLRATAVVADFGVYAIGEVQRRRAFRQVDGVT
nr:hypothetical protein [Tanacetum cinerariifolium]